MEAGVPHVRRDGGPGGIQQDVKGGAGIPGHVVRTAAVPLPQQGLRVAVRGRQLPRRHLEGGGGNSFALRGILRQDGEEAEEKIPAASLGERQK